MVIKSITVGGFKNLKKTKINLEKIVILVSLNNYGKSNFLEAVSFGVNFLTASNKMRKLMMGWSKGVPLVPELAHDNFEFEIEFDDPTLGQYKHVKYGFSFSWISDSNNGQRITNEWIESRNNESVRYSSFLKRSESKYRKGYSTQAYRKIVLDNAQLAIDILSSIENIEIIGVIKSIQSVKYQTCNSLDLHDRFIPPPFEFILEKDESSIIFDDDDLPKALFLLRKKYPSRFDLFKEAVFSLFPEFNELSLQAFELKEDSSKHTNYFFASANELNNPNIANNGNEVPFKIKEEMYRLIINSSNLNQPINASLMSAGTKRIIWLLANVFISSCGRTSLLGIEELETSIHPKLLKKLLEIIIESQEGTNIISSSHSPFLIQYLKPNQIYLGIPNMGTAAFKRIADSKSKALSTASRNLGVSIGEYLFELMAGGSDSIDILNQYLEESAYG